MITKNVNAGLFPVKNVTFFNNYDEKGIEQQIIIIRKLAAAVLNSSRSSFASHHLF